MAVIWQLYTSGMLRICSSRALAAQKHGPRPLCLLAPGMAEQQGELRSAYLVALTPRRKKCPVRSLLSQQGPRAQPAPVSALCFIYVRAPQMPAAPPCALSQLLCPPDTTISALLFLICMLVNEGFVSFLGLPLWHRGASSHSPPSCSGVPRSREAAVAAWLIASCCLTAAGH